MHNILLTVILTLTLTLGGCTRAEKSTKLLENLGYDNIQIKGYGWFSCSKEDWFHTAFTATSPKNKEIKGVVCSGLLFRNSTIRWS